MKFIWPLMPHYQLLHFSIKFFIIFFWFFSDQDEYIPEHVLCNSHILEFVIATILIFWIIPKQIGFLDIRFDRVCLKRNLNLFTHHFWLLNLLTIANGPAIETFKEWSTKEFTWVWLFNSLFILIVVWPFVFLKFKRIHHIYKFTFFMICFENCIHPYL